MSSPEATQAMAQAALDLAAEIAAKRTSPDPAT
jgi:hypothetical protein